MSLLYNVGFFVRLFLILKVLKTNISRRVINYRQTKQRWSSNNLNKYQRYFSLAYTLISMLSDKNRYNFLIIDSMNN